MESIDNPVVLVTAGYDHTQVNALCITTDKRFVAAAGNPKVHFYDASHVRTEAIHVFEGHAANVVSIGFDKDARWMYSGCEDGTLKLWDTRTAKCERTCDNKKAGGLLHSAVLHPNQVELFSCDHSGRVKVWDLTTNAPSFEISLDQTPLQSLSIAPDGSLLVAADFRGKVYVWDLFNLSSANKSEPRLTIDAHEGHPVTKCVISPDSTKLATSSADHTVKIWDISNGFALATTLMGHSKWVWDCVFSADSAYLMSASSDHTARLWDLGTGEVLRSYLGHEKAVVAIALNDISTF